MKLLSLPREVGKHPEDGEPITAGLGRFGPYIKHGKLYKSLPPEDDVITIGLNRAVSLLAEPSKGRRRKPDPIRIVGKHPADNADIELYKGRYGPYVSHDGLHASLPGGTEPEALTLDEAVRLLAERAEKLEASGKRRRKSPKAAVAKDPADPTAAKPKAAKSKKKTAAKGKGSKAKPSETPPTHTGRVKRAATG
jgi:DNA topoisomerase-1